MKISHPIYNPTKMYSSLVWPTAIYNSKSKGRHLPLLSVVFLALLWLISPWQLSGQSVSMASSWLANHGQSVFLKPHHFANFPIDGTDDTKAIAHRFIKIYEEQFGPTAMTEGLRWKKVNTDQFGGQHIEATQYYKGAAVYDGFIRFHFSPEGQLTTVQSHLLPIPPDFNIQVGQSPIHIDRAHHFLNATYPHLLTKDWKLEQQEDVIFYPGLVKGELGNGYHAYQQFWRATDGTSCEVFLDINTAKTLAHYPTTCSLLERQLFHLNIYRPIWHEGEEPPSIVEHQYHLEVQTQIYNLFHRTFDRRSFDGNDAPFKTVLEATSLNCPNASWNGISTNFCAGVASDDVIAHEWMHAYTQHMSGLVYVWQAGAINEALSDIWGELIDQLNDTQTAPLREENCDGERWKIAEDVRSIPGPIRDLWAPECHDDPAFYGHPLFDCDDAYTDNGGVHSNSGILNRLFAYLVDGNTQLTPRLQGIGATKAAHLFWQMQTYYLSRTTDFMSLTSALTAAADDIKGRNLRRLTLSNRYPGLSDMFFTPIDSATLQRVIAIQGLTIAPDPCPSFVPLLEQSPPATCNVLEGSFQPFFEEDFEGDWSANWSVTSAPGNSDTWQERQWTVQSQLPTQRPGRAAFAATPNIGNNTNNAQHGIIYLTSPIVQIPEASAEDMYLRFDHYIALEPSKDGGALSIRANDGDWIRLPANTFIYNSYTKLMPPGPTSVNPFARQWVFNGTDENSTSGSWGTSLLNLAYAGVRPGDYIQLRWELSTDRKGGLHGWYVDDIQLGACAFQSFLPVEWLSFDAKPQVDGIQLNWSTIEDNSNIGYTIERSIDGRVFKDLHFIAKHTSAEDVYYYHWLDRTAIAGQNYYYRLRQIDRDGAFSYSKTVRVQLGQTDEDWQVYPNPAVNQLTIKWPKAYPTATVKLYNTNHQIVSSQSLAWTAPHLSVHHLPSGIYYIAVQLSDQISVKRLVIE